MGRVVRGALQSLHDHALDVGVGDPTRGPRAQLVHQPVQPPVDEAPPPPADRDRVDVEMFRDFAVGFALGWEPQNARTQSQGLGSLAAPYLPRELFMLLVAHDELRQRSSPSHLVPPSMGDPWDEPLFMSNL